MAGDLHVALATERLCALLDGLAVDAVLQPDRLDPDTAMGILRRHLDSLQNG